MKARKVSGISERGYDDDATVRDTVQKGDFEILTEPNGQRRFWFKCPGNCGTVAPIALRPVINPAHDTQSWAFDGNEEAPTLKPSINHQGCWHGWLTAGEFRL